ncbi:aspartate carbamoyltransferase catalytic subunit [Streptomyces sp. NPDC001793]|uniref:aspartate carbamoyltransferase catalytic subunit n=1 Tax=Streptomyces sp. NPDC001793 TaxID=3154657 RepID=UPI0033188379
MRSLLSTEGMSRADALSIVAEALEFRGASSEASDASELSGAFQVEPSPQVRPLLRGRTVATLFYEASTRTRASFELAAKRLGAQVVNLSAGGSSVDKGESLRDTARTLAMMGVDCVIVRHPASGAPHRIAGWLAGTGTRVVNAGDGMHEHPTQALLDVTTLWHRLGALAGKKITIVGDVLHSRVARSNMHLLSTLGARIALVAPATLVPGWFASWARSMQISVGHDLDAELPTTDAIMMLRIQTERMQGGFFPSMREYAENFQLSAARAELLQEKAVVLHPGPVLRGHEISSAVAESSRSLIGEQVRNGVYVRMAVLRHLLDGRVDADGRNDA